MLFVNNIVSMHLLMSMTIFCINQKFIMISARSVLSPLTYG